MAVLRILVVNIVVIFSQVACGLNHTMCVSADGSTVWAFGDGDYGKLGIGSTAAKSSPQVTRHTMEPDSFREIQRKRDQAVQETRLSWIDPLSCPFGKLLDALQRSYI